MTATGTFYGFRRQLRKRGIVELSNGEKSVRHVPDGYETADVEVTVDLGIIARQLATRAMGSKKGVSKYMHGAVVVRVINRKRDAS